MEDFLTLTLSRSESFRALNLDTLYKSEITTILLFTYFNLMTKVKVKVFYDCFFYSYHPKYGV